MAFGRKFHEFFDTYIANPYGEVASALGGLALIAKAGYESVEFISAYPEIEGSDILKLIGWAVGAVAVVGFSREAARHYRNPLHTPAKPPPPDVPHETPPKKAAPTPIPPCMVARFRRYPQKFQSDTTHVCVAQEVSGADPPAFCEHSGNVQRVMGSTFLNEQPGSFCLVDLGKTVDWPEPNNQGETT